MLPPVSHRAALVDLAWRVAFQLGYPVARLWWRATRPRHEGALVVVRVGDQLLLLRSPYRKTWNFPGGGVWRGELPEAAARRELMEETGLVASGMVRVGMIAGLWEGRDDQVHFFELCFDQLPPMTLDNREIIEARLFSPSELKHLPVTGPVGAYLERYASSF